MEGRKRSESTLKIYTKSRMARTVCVCMYVCVNKLSLSHCSVKWTYKSFLTALCWLLSHHNPGHQVTWSLSTISNFNAGVRLHTHAHTSHFHLHNDYTLYLNLLLTLTSVKRRKCFCSVVFPNKSCKIYFMRTRWLWHSPIITRTFRSSQRAKHMVTHPQKKVYSLIYCTRTHTHTHRRSALVL